MRRLKVLTFVLFAVALALPFTVPRPAESQGASEAPTGFDTRTNDSVGTLANQATHDADRATFEERDGVADGLGPLYNAQSCAECHNNPVTGGIARFLN